MVFLWFHNVSSTYTSTSMHVYYIMMQHGSRPSKMVKLMGFELDQVWVLDRLQPYDPYLGFWGSGQSSMAYIFLHAKIKK